MNEAVLYDNFLHFFFVLVPVTEITGWVPLKHRLSCGQRFGAVNEPGGAVMVIGERPNGEKGVSLPRGDWRKCSGSGVAIALGNSNG